MADKIRLEYEDYRPLRKGEGGYSATKRQLVSPSTGDIISRRQFTKLATRVPISQVSAKGTYSKVSGQRKPRRDKGISRKDYQELVRPLFQEKEQQKRKRLSHDTGVNRFQSAHDKWIFRENKRREERGYYPLPSDYEIDDPQFYDYYDVIKHPESHGGQEIMDARDYFYDTEYEDEPDFDYPWGETP